MAPEQPLPEQAEHFTEDGFWDKVRRYAVSAGAEVIQKALCMYYSFRDPDTPMMAKGIIAGALGYFIMPFDVIPDTIPVVGYADDLAVLATAIAAVAIHVKREHVNRADEQMKDWFEPRKPDGE